MSYGRRPTLGVPAQETNMAIGYPFEQALIWLKHGKKITRRGWNGQGMFVFLVNERSVIIGDNDDTRPLEGLYGHGQEVQQASRFDMRYADGRFGVWEITQDDVKASDWNLLL